MGAEGLGSRVSPGQVQASVNEPQQHVAPTVPPGLWILLRSGVGTEPCQPRREAAVPVGHPRGPHRARGATSWMGLLQGGKLGLSSPA